MAWGVQPLIEKMEARRQAAGPKIAPSAERIEGRLAAGPITFLAQNYIGSFLKLSFLQKNLVIKMH